jgi:hypothetical protein
VGFGVAKAINNHGQVVGHVGCVTSAGFDDYTYAAIWDAEHGWRNINDLIPPGTDWTLDAATAINDRGQIVGYGHIGSDLDTSNAFLLTPNTRDWPASRLHRQALLVSGIRGTRPNDTSIPEFVRAPALPAQPPSNNATHTSTLLTPTNSTVRLAGANKTQSDSSNLSAWMVGPSFLSAPDAVAASILSPDLPHLPG